MTTLATHAAHATHSARAAPSAVLLIGPTASGKTGAALHLADRLPVDLISVDSAMVFRDMNIGTAKPDAATLARYPHRLVDVVSPEEAYSAGRFRDEAGQAIADSHARGRIPVLVGGTMLYVKALTEGLSDLPRADPATRAAIDAEAAERGWPALYADLARIDPVAAARMEPTNAQRIQRALEVIRLTGRPMSELWAAGRSEPASANFLTIALLPEDRGVLHARIATRFSQMLRDGLVDEVAMLREKYALTPELPSMRCVGYRQVWEMQDGLIPLRELPDRGIFATRQLAKRQLTWLRSMENLTVIDCLASDLESRVRSAVEAFIAAH